MNDNAPLTYEQFEAEVRRAFPEHVVDTSFDGGPYKAAVTRAGLTLVEVRYRASCDSNRWSVTLDTTVTYNTSLGIALLHHHRRVERDLVRLQAQQLVLAHAAIRAGATARPREDADARLGAEPA